MANVAGVSVACVVTYSVSGTVVGLATAAPAPVSFELYNTVNAVVTDLGRYPANSPPNFTFITGIVSGGAYSLSTAGYLPTNPYSNCTITNASSSNVTSNVTNVVIDCTAL
jgi:hypothetical protein